MSRSLNDEWPCRFPPREKLSEVAPAAPCSVRCEVAFPHCREIDGVLYMLEPMFSGILTLPNDEDTQKALARGWLTEVPPNDALTRPDQRPDGRLET